MSFGNSAGVYTRIQDKSFVTSGSGVLAGGIVITSKKGPTDVNVVTNAEQFVQQYGYPSRDNPSMYVALRFLNRAGFLSIKRVINDATAATAELNAVDGTTTQLDITAANEGAWGNNITVNIEENTDFPVGVFELVVLENDNEVERFQVSRDQNAVNGFGRSIFIEDVINGYSNYITVVDIVDGETAYNDTTVDLTGGTDDTTAPNDTAIASAWDDFLNVEEVSARFLINAGWATPTVQTKMISVAESRRDAYAILDVPQEANSNVQAMVTYRKDELSSDSYHGGLYGGWLKLRDANTGINIEVPASGDVAANFVQGASREEIWTPIMGLNLGSIPNTLGTTVKMDEGSRDLAYQNGINPVTKIGVNNAVIWGQKTLQSYSSGLDRANVVTNVKDMDIRIKDALLPFVGRINTSSVRESMRYLVDSFLEGRKRRGGLYDFYVDVSDRINTPQVIDQQKALVDVYVQPVRGMEFIRATLIVTPTGVSLQQ